MPWTLPLILLCVLAVALLLLAAAAPLASRFFSCRITPLVPLPDAEGPDGEAALAAAAGFERAGLRFVGVFRNGQVERFPLKVSLFLSDDRQTLAVLPAAAGLLGYRLESQKPDGGLWVTTSQGGGDVSGLHDEDVIGQDMPAGEAARRHRKRVAADAAAGSSPPLLWDADALVGDCLRRARLEAEAVISKGRGRWLDDGDQSGGRGGSPERWRFTTWATLVSLEHVWEHPVGPSRVWAGAGKEGEEGGCGPLMQPDAASRGPRLTKPGEFPDMLVGHGLLAGVRGK